MWIEVSRLVAGMEQSSKLDEAQARKAQKEQLGEWG
jgi:hypothetical protein